MLERTMIAFITGSCFALAGCAAPLDAPAVEDPELSPLGDRGGLNNGTPPLEFKALPFGYMKDMKQVALTQAGLDSSPTFQQFLDNAPSVFKDFVRCALPPGQSVTLSRWGVAHTYVGENSFAPYWATTPPVGWEATYPVPYGYMASRLRLVTGCMGALLNATGTHVPIMLSVDDPTVQDDPPDHALYTFKEITVFGDLFADNYTSNYGPIFVCTEDNLDVTCAANTTDYLQKRLCGDPAINPMTPNQCHVEMLGKCKDICYLDVGTGKRTCRHPTIPTATLAPFPDVVTVKLPRSSLKSMDVAGKCNLAVSQGCADGAPEDIFYPGYMVGCSGSVSFNDRNSLCAPGYSACSAWTWQAVHDWYGGPAPSHHYWTSDNLQYAGSGPGQCGAAVSGGVSCSYDPSNPTPMRLCKPQTPFELEARYGYGPRYYVPDEEGNTCNWTGCGYEPYGQWAPSQSWAPEQYFGGCVGNSTAGTACCVDYTGCATDLDCHPGTGFYCDQSSFACKTGCHNNSNCPSASHCAAGVGGATGECVSNLW
jgi:hypothetical protein